MVTNGQLRFLYKNLRKQLIHSFTIIVVCCGFNICIYMLDYPISMHPSVRFAGKTQPIGVYDAVRYIRIAQPQIRSLQKDQIILHHK